MKLKRLLPDAVRSELNRTAHFMAHRHYIETRRRLEGEALAMLKAGSSADEVLHWPSSNEAKCAHARARARLASEQGKSNAARAAQRSTSSGRLASKAKSK